MTAARRTTTSPTGWEAALSGWGLGSARRQAVGLVLDFEGDARQRLAVLPPVVRAEQKLSASGEHDAYVCLGTATVAQVQCTERLRRGYSAGHVASLASCHWRGSRAVIRFSIYYPKQGAEP